MDKTRTFSASAKNPSPPQPPSLLSHDELLKKQNETMQEQDRVIDELGHSIKKLKQISIAINTELDDQNKILEDLNENTDHTHSRLKSANKQVHKLKKEIKSPCTIM